VQRRGRHYQIRIIGLDSRNHLALVRFARHDGGGVDRRVPLIQTQVGFPRGAVRTVALKALVGQDRPNIPVVLQWLLGATVPRRWENEDGRENTPRKFHETRHGNVPVLSKPGESLIFVGQVSQRPRGPSRSSDGARPTDRAGRTPAAGDRARTVASLREVKAISQAPLLCAPQRRARQLLEESVTETSHLAKFIEPTA
jgi:hypothetical protein